MAHERPRTRWQARLLMLALETERAAAEAGEGALATHLKTGIYWHVAMRGSGGENARSQFSAAARALKALEAKSPPLVRVERNGGKIRRYYLTTHGRTRAAELLENDGFTAKAANRNARESSRSRRKAKAAELTRRRRELEELLFDMDSPLLDRVLSAPLNKKMELEGVTFSTYDEVPEIEDAWRVFEDPVDQLVLLVLELSDTRTTLRTAKQAAKLHLRGIRHNDAAWPEYRARLIAKGEPIESDADWRDLPLDYFLHGPLLWTGRVIVNPIALAETVDKREE